MKIKDIAKELNLSVSTVSKALNGAFDVSKETKDIVVKYARTHGYKSRDERLKTKKKRRLCILYTTMESKSQNSIIIPLALSFSKYAIQNNFEVIQVPIESLETNYDQFMIKNNYDGGFILGINYESPINNDLKNTTIPTVLYDNIINSEKVATITNENINSIANIVNLLYSKGHKKIGFIHGDKNSYVSNERFAGYIIGQVMNNILYNPNYVYYGKFTEQSGYDAALYFAKTDVTAIVCASDTIAIGLIRGFKQLNISVPKDISVTGFDGLEISKYFSPSLTTIKQDLELMGERAFFLLTSIMMNRSSQRIVINGNLLVGESIAEAKQNEK